MSKTTTETPTLRNSADIPWEETRLYLPADETEEENKALYARLKKEIAEAFEWAYEQPLLTGDVTKGSDKVFSNTEGGKL